jgi:hypothetical protein
MTGWTKPKSECFCAFCKSRRNIYPKKHASFLNFVGILGFAFCLSTGLWTWWDPRAIIIFVVTLTFAETFIYLRWRFSVVCSLCGFDPVLYRKSPESARDRVRQFYEKRTQDPNFMMSKSPLVELYRRSLDVKRRNNAVRQMLDRKAIAVEEAAAKGLAPRAGGPRAPSVRET